MEAVLASAAIAALYTLELLAVAWVFARKRDAASAFSWALAIFFLPLLGLVLFVVFGRDRLPHRLKGKIRHSAAFQARMAAQVPRGEAPADSRQGWQSLGRVAEQLGNMPVRGGNRVELLGDGEAAFNAIRESVLAATHHVHVEEYIFRDDRKGRELLKLLCERARQGLQVRLLVDAIGTGESRKLARQLVASGGKAAVFLPLYPFGKAFTPNLRNHRKIIICDGRVGFLGGMNVGNEYFGLKYRNRYWCDWHMAIRGPAVRDLQSVFAEDWDFAAGSMLGPEYFPDPETCGDSRVQIVYSGPDEAVNSARAVFFAAITQAEKRLCISSPYFVPDQAMREALRGAALRGVRVQVLTQGHPPEMLSTYYASRYYWEELMGAGVEVWEHMRRVLHAKALIADSRWAAIGSVNLDPRSLNLNFEVLGLLDSVPDAEAAQQHFEGMLQAAQRVDPEVFRRRGIAGRVAEGAFRLLSPLL
ncbi:MAG: cardiolipin synthase [Planctomycetes bacterium]|nr:cardiolipin synthase [Planctomycetota bacterium]